MDRVNAVNLIEGYAPIKIASPSILLTPKIVNSCQEDQRPSGAGYFGGAEAPVANPGSGILGEIRNER